MPFGYWDSYELIALLLIIRAIMMPKDNVTNRELKSDFIIEVI